MKTQSLKIGVLGSRGIPNRYGGYEQFASHLGPRLAERGHEVWVYNSSRHPLRAATWQGVHRIIQPDPEGRLGAFGQFVYDYHCLRDARRRGFDILLQLGYTSNALWSFLWPREAVNLLHMDGLEWKRSKYRPPVRFFLRAMEARAARRGDALIADSPAIQAHLWERYRLDSTYVPYGAEVVKQAPEGPVRALGLTPGAYHLAVARFVPENNLEAIAEGHLRSDPAEPLVLVGDAATAFGRRLRARYGGPGSGIRFTGPRFEPAEVDSLRFHARFYWHGHSVGGTNPSLLEAMACGVPVGAHDNPFNRTVLGEEAFYFKSAGDVARITGDLTRSGPPSGWAAVYRRKIEARYNWEGVVDRMEALCRAVLSSKQKALP